MSATRILEIALRVMGLWFFFHSIIALTTFSFYLSVPAATDYIWGAVATVIVQFLLSGILIFGAPAIAAWFYPPVGESEGVRVVVGPGDIYRTACFILGAYLLVAAAHPAGRLLIVGLGRNAFSQQAADAVTFIVYVSSGLLLVFGSRRIAEVLSKLRYNPDTIPQQQFSLAMLLILIVVVSVVLGVFRMLSPGR